MLNTAHKFVCSILIILAVAPVAVSQTTAARSAISTLRIMDAMALAGVAASPDQIELLSRVNGTAVNATMRVVNVSHAAAGTLKVRLRCQDNHECLPFYVLVHGLEPVKLGGAEVHTVAAAEPTPLHNVVRGGDRAILILETPDSRMSFPVICLQSGAPGQKVRVTSPDRRRFYDAEVVAAGVLKGSF